MGKKFQGTIHDSGAAIGGWYLELSADCPEQMGVAPNARVMMTMGEDTLHRALRNSKNGYTYITLNLKLVKKYHLKEGMKMEVELSPDKSEYGSEFPEELREVMEQDPEGKDLFMRANPGMQRNILYYISSAKGVDTRIKRALFMMHRVREWREEGRIK